MVGRRYGCRPSDIIRGNLEDLDFDAAVAIRADRLERGEITDPKLVKQRQSEGFAAVKALQERAKALR